MRNHYLSAVLVIAGACQTADHMKKEPVEDTEAYWRERVSTLRKGQKRSEVDAVLPILDDGGGYGASGTGSRYVVGYPVSPNWSVHVTFAYGSTADPHPGDRVVGDSVRLVSSDGRSIDVPLSR